jgi:hypothetical protein
VHPRDAEVVAEGVKVREAVGRIGDADRDEGDRGACPKKANHDFDVEVHAASEGVAVEEGEGGGEGINAEATHAVFDLQGEGLEPDPEVRDEASVAARGRDRGVEDGVARDEGGGSGAGGSEEERGGGGVVLAVGVELEGVGVAKAGSSTEASDDGTAFALVRGVAEEGDGGRLARGARGGGGRQREGWGAGVVYDEDGEAEGGEGSEEGGEGGGVVVAGDDDAGEKGRGRGCGRGRGWWGQWVHGAKLILPLLAVVPSGVV